MTITVFLDGLNQIGYSLALALPRTVFELQAFDPDGKLLRKLKREKVLKKFVGQVAQGCKNANIIIINQPVDFLELHYEAIGLNITQGTVVVDTSPVPLFAGKLADRFLPAGTAFVSMIPAFNLEALKEQSFVSESANPDLFSESTVAISTPSTKLKDAEQIASRLADAVGATVVYMDAYEAQEAMVKTQILPKYLALAFQRTVEAHPSWRDEQRIASADYYQVTNALMGMVELEQPELAAMENKESLLRSLDEYIAAFQEVRNLIEKGDKKALNKLINETYKTRAGWQEERKRNSFAAEGAPVDLPENDMFQRMLLGGLARKNKKK
ncbi:MAG: hypothetical protein V2J07_04360 [Anaerolineae bacterium]|jgi:prephenate dehydrogenase|nr:hypothetical protein [Anaerolineae bacterium]